MMKLHCKIVERLVLVPVAICFMGMGSCSPQSPTLPFHQAKIIAGNTDVPSNDWASLVIEESSNGKPSDKTELHLKAADTFQYAVIYQTDWRKSGSINIRTTVYKIRPIKNGTTVLDKSKYINPTTSVMPDITFSQR